jgi:cyclophilin family peptidyl-prolyl cis-trans isomerase
MKRFTWLVFLGLVIAFGYGSQGAFSGQGNEEQLSTSTQEEEAVVEEEVAVITTKFGQIILEFYPEDAPQHVKNFKKLAREGSYDGCTFHRIIPDFMIQGGDPNSKDDIRANDGLGGPGYTIPAEIERKHKRGALAAARQGDQVNPERRSSGSQFYICVVKTRHLDGLYTVFGQTIDGFEVIDEIVSQPRDARDNPKERIEMRVEIAPRSEVMGMD